MKIDPNKIGRMRGADLDVPVGANGILEPQGVGQRFKTTFVGWEEGKFVVVRLPAKLDLRDTLYTGKPVIVRFMNCGGQICGFESAIQTSIVTPHRLLFLDFPTTIEFLSMRKENRVDCFLPAILHRADDVMEGRLLNISKGGCRFVTHQERVKQHPPLELEALVDCEFKILGQEDAMYLVKASVKKIHEEKGLANVGLQFAEAPEDMQQRIDEYVAEAITILGPSCRIDDLK
jgi:c-di-GMP-binding flagellar brake protein YcgR